ncbi:MULTISPECIES: CBS domain-containing protein [Gammaproteobacteria]|jgi:CBS domain-containing protein|uniref:Inosine-5-monophosphate dehydrogenase n=1 Tax=Xanthomonas boreopolis TaxID=86183 RepID=A0A919F8D4_9XANT|nr:CBS domain-containing protein [Pseudomonas sp. Hp2]GHH54933.1 inosine-5-monophosphate dehydrogenase [[Pseudomonas] boreopolis]
MIIKDVMSRDVTVIGPEQTLREAAVLMRQNDIGSLPVGEHDRLVGMLTDRDIVVRALASGSDADSPVREAMSGSIKYCFEDDDVDSIASNMASLQIRRLPVVDRDKRLVGIVSLSNMAHSEDMACGVVARGVARPH